MFTCGVKSWYPRHARWRQIGGLPVFAQPAGRVDSGELPAVTPPAACGDDHVAENRANTLQGPRQLALKHKNQGGGSCRRDMFLYMGATCSGLMEPLRCRRPDAAIRLSRQ